MRRFVLLAVLLPTIAFAEYPPVQAQMKLQEGMTMEEVTKLLGEPQSVSSGTCVALTGKLGPCRTWTYEGSGRFFRVTFAKPDDSWVVNNWH